MASRVPVSPLSAAHTLVSWIIAQGREPAPVECRVSNGLMSRQCLMQKLPSSSFSACISAARMLVSQAPLPRLQTCLGPGCATRFLYQGYHFCQSCRVALGYADDDFTRTGRYLRAQDQAITERQACEAAYHAPADGIEEDELWSDADTVTGFDDLVASQMNAWSRVSRKRRYFREG